MPPVIPLATADNPLRAVLGPQLVGMVGNLLGALGILVLGFVVAALLARGVRRLLRRTGLDGRIAGAVSGSGERPIPPLERLLAAVVFWVVMVLAIVAALNVLQLTTVSEPLNQFLNQIFSYLPKLGAAAVLAALGWLVATLARVALRRVTQGLGQNKLLAPPADGADPAATPVVQVGNTLAEVVYWLVLLFFLPLVLNALNLGSQVTPVVNLFDTFLAALPQIAKAALIAAVGWFLARTVRLLVANLLASSGIDQVGAGFGLDPQQGGRKLSWLVGTVVYVLILIPTATAALDALAIAAISDPATAMLDRILSALPQIFTAVLVLALGVVAGRFVGQLVSRLLAGVGFDRLYSWMGMEGLNRSGDGAVGSSPSHLVGVVAQVGVVLFAAVAATNVLALPGLAEVVEGLLLLFGQILSGLVVFAVGLYLAQLAHHLVSSSSGHQAPLLAQTARVAIIGFSGAMALQQIGVAPNIVGLAFGLVLGSLAVAAAVAFGLGGREVAAEQLREWVASLKGR
ncbi:MAG: mechanosensitive ion channel [Cyanobacteria bacterium J06638_7]